MASIESTESSSPIVTRAVAAGLQDRYCDNYEFPGWQKTLLTALGALPAGVGRTVVSRFQTLSGLPASVLDTFSIDAVIQERLADYSSLKGQFPAVTIGAALGGASSYLSLATGGPFLPQAFVVTLKGGSMDGDPWEYLQRSIGPARRIADENPALMTIQHFDPVHDGWLTRFVNHLRFKLLDLPGAYRDFIRTRLQPSGSVIFLEGGAEWLRYRLGPRSVFQIGGWGGISAEEFLRGSERLDQYAKKAGLKHSRWSVEDYPLESGPESEWGTEVGLGEALEEFCQAEGYNFVRIHLAHPNDFSRLAFVAANRLIEKDGQSPAGVLVEMFSQFDSTAARKAGLLPLWLVFNTNDSLEYLHEMTGKFPPGKPIFFSPLSTFSLTPDLVPFHEWEAVLREWKWVNAGARASHYPADTRALVSWSKNLRAWANEHPQQIQSVLTPDEIAGMAGAISLEKTS